MGRSIDSKSPVAGAIGSGSPAAAPRPARGDGTHARRFPVIEQKAKTILVTGGAGFLGSHLAERLASVGHDVYCLDNLHTGSRENLFGFTGTGKIHLVEHDIVKPLPELPKFDEIYNLACPASPVHYQEDPVATLRVCSEGVWNVLARAAHDRADVFHTSTSEVYGDPLVHPQREGYHGNVNTVGPRSCYDEGKRFAETMLTDFCRMHDLRLRMVRIFNTYGPRMHPQDGRVVSNFIMQALRNEPITINGDGSQTRSFCYVDDMIEGFQMLMAGGDDARGPMNIGNPAEITVGELAELVVKMTGSRSPIVYLPLPKDDPLRRRPDITRAQKVLGWKPRTHLEQGLKATIAYFEGIIERDSWRVALDA